MLVDLIVSSYYRALHLESTANRIIFSEDGGYSINQDKSKIVDDLFKAIERAHNQYFKGLMLLQGLKQKIPQITVNAQQAVVGGQQYFQK
jgi:hypothetical protein